MNIQGEIQISVWLAFSMILDSILTVDVYLGVADPSTSGAMVFKSPPSKGRVWLPLLIDVK